MARTQNWVYVHCDLDLGVMILGQGHDTLLSHGQQLCEILYRSNLTVRSYSPGMDFGYVCTVTLILEIDTLLGYGQQLCEILSRSDKLGGGGGGGRGYNTTYV